MSEPLTNQVLILLMVSPPSSGDNLVGIMMSPYVFSQLLSRLKARRVGADGTVEFVTAHQFATLDDVFTLLL